MWSSLLIISFVKSVKFSSQLAVDDTAIKDTCCNASARSRERKAKIIVREYKASLFTCTTLENVKLNDLKQQKKDAHVLVACSNFRTSCSIAWNYNTL